MHLVDHDEPERPEHAAYVLGVVVQYALQGLRGDLQNPLRVRQEPVFPVRVDVPVPPVHGYAGLPEHPVHAGELVVDERLGGPDVHCADAVDGVGEQG